MLELSCRWLTGFGEGLSRTASACILGVDVCREAVFTTLDQAHSVIHMDQLMPHTLEVSPMLAAKSKEAAVDGETDLSCKCHVATAHTKQVPGESVLGFPSDWVGADPTERFERREDGLCAPTVTDASETISQLALPTAQLAL